MSSIELVDVCKGSSRAAFQSVSASSGAPRSEEADCITQFEDRLLSAGLVDPAALDQVREEATAEIDQAVEKAMAEPAPQRTDVEKCTYAASKVDAVYPDDYTGLPD